MKSQKHLLLFCCLVIHLIGFSQTSSRPISLGIEGGSFVYQGDLTPSFAGNLSQLKPMVGLFVSKQFYPHFALKASIAKGNLLADESIYGSPAWRQLRAFSFNSHLTEIATTIVFDFADQSLDQSRRLTPYVFAGLGIGFLKVSRDWHNINVAAFDPKSSLILGLGVDTLKNPPSILPVLPVGMGLRYAFNNRWSMHTELGLRLTMSDYMDGFSKSGNPKAKDSYYALKLGISFQLGNSGIKCPPNRR